AKKMAEAVIGHTLVEHLGCREHDVRRRLPHGLAGKRNPITPDRGAARLAEQALAGGSRASIFVPPHKSAQTGSSGTTHVAANHAVICPPPARRQPSAI